MKWKSKLKPLLRTETAFRFGVDCIDGPEKEVIEEVELLLLWLALLLAVAS